MSRNRFFREGSSGFTLIELLVVVAILGLLLMMLFPVLNRFQEKARDTTSISRMKTVGTALLAGAADNRGYIISWPSTRGRWPTANHKYFGIRTDLDATRWGDGGVINPIAYTAEVMRPVHLDYMRKEMLDGTRPAGPVGIWLLNYWFLANGKTAPPAFPPKPLMSVVSPSSTPLLGMSSEDNGLGLTGKAIHPSAREQGFKGQSDASGGPAPRSGGRMFYLMCDGSFQAMPDFWPFNESAPWKFFHPLGDQAPESDAP